MIKLMAWKLSDLIHRKFQTKHNNLLGDRHSYAVQQKTCCHRLPPKHRPLQNTDNTMHMLPQSLARLGFGKKGHPPPTDQGKLMSRGRKAGMVHSTPGIYNIVYECDCVLPRLGRPCETRVLRILLSTIKERAHPSQYQASPLQQTLSTIHPPVPDVSPYHSNSPVRHPERMKY